MKSILGRTVLSTLLLLAACTTSTVKISGSDAAQLKGKGLAISVEPVGTVSSNLDSGKYFGALGQAASGSALQEKLQLTDPALKVKELLEKAMKEKYNTTAGTDYKLTLKTTQMTVSTVFMGKDDNVLTLAIIIMKLYSPSGDVIASIAFNGSNDVSKFPISPADVAAGNGEKVRRAFDDVAEKATAKFWTVLSD